MNKSGPIVLIDDDHEDLQLLIEIFADLNLPNEIHLFKTADSALTFLKQENVYPFFIISDINMPKVSGFQFREMIRNDAALNKKRIPFMFFTTASTIQVVSDSDDLSIQGVFIKPTKAAEWHQTLKTIVSYWQLSMSPDQYHL
ncbi:MAG: response regulator [Flavitalea sp.]